MELQRVINPSDDATRAPANESAQNRATTIARERAPTARGLVLADDGAAPVVQGAAPAARRDQGLLASGRRRLEIRQLALHVAEKLAGRTPV